MGRELNLELSKAIKNLRDSRNTHNKLGLEMLNAHNGSLYPMDLFAIGVLNRSVSLLEGFCDLIEKKNCITAFAILRLQLDNLLRFRAAWLVENPHDFVFMILKGGKIRNTTDREGNKMTDAYLVASLIKNYPELEKIYESTSNYIHLSDKHILHTIQNINEEGRVDIKVGPEGDNVPEKIYFEAITAFTKITSILFRHIHGWTVTKEGNFQSENIKNHD